MRTSARRATELLKALSNENRLLILCHLVEGEKSVGELQRVVGLRQSALSQHLARLRQDELVQTRRVAQTIYYSLRGDEAKQVLALLHHMYCAPTSHEVVPSAGEIATYEPMAPGNFTPAAGNAAIGHHYSLAAVDDNGSC